MPIFIKDQSGTFVPVDISVIVGKLPTYGQPIRPTRVRDTTETFASICRRFVTADMRATGLQRQSGQQSRVLEHIRRSIQDMTFLKRFIIKGPAVLPTSNYDPASDSPRPGLWMNDSGAVIVTIDKLGLNPLSIRSPLERSGPAMTMAEIVDLVMTKSDQDLNKTRPSGKLHILGMIMITVLEVTLAEEIANYHSGRESDPATMVALFNCVAMKRYQLGWCLFGLTICRGRKRSRDERDGDRDEDKPTVDEPMIARAIKEWEWIREMGQRQDVVDEIAASFGKVQFPIRFECDRLKKLSGGCAFPALTPR